MTGDRPWLPTNAPVPPALNRALGEAVEEWSGKWFAADPLSAGPLTRRSQPDLDWQAIEEGLMLGLAPAAPLTIGARVLGLSSDDRSPADSKLIEAVVAEAVVDLRQRLATLVQAPRAAALHPARAAASHVASIGEPHRPLLAIALTAELFATLALQSLPPSDPPPLGTGEDALERLPVAVGAAMGRCRLSVADFEALGLGDVLVLDRAVDRAVPLTMAGASLERGSCTVVEGEPPLLKIIEPVA